VVVDQHHRVVEIQLLVMVKILFLVVSQRLQAAVAKAVMLLEQVVILLELLEVLEVVLQQGHTLEVESKEAKELLAKEIKVVNQEIMLIQVIILLVVEVLVLLVEWLFKEIYVVMVDKVLHP